MGEPKDSFLGDEPRDAEEREARSFREQEEQETVERVLQSLWDERFACSRDEVMGRIHRQWLSWGEIHAAQEREAAEIREPEYNLLGKIIEGHKQRITAALFPSERFMEMKPSDPETKNEQAEAMTKIILSGLRKGNLERVVQDQLLDDWFIYGNALGEVVYDEKVVKRLVRDKMAKEGETAVVELSSRMRWLADAHCHIRRISPLQFFPARTAGVGPGALDELPHFIVQRAASWESLYELRERVETARVGGVPVKMKVGRFRDLPSREAVSPVHPLGIDDTGNELPAVMAGITDQEGSKVDGFRVWECWTRGDWESIFSKRNKENRLMISGQDIRRFMDDWDLTDADMGPSTGWWRITILPDVDRIIEVTRNPFPDDLIPFFLSTPEPIPDHLTGRGFYEKFYGMQRGISSVCRSVNDAVRRTAEPMYGLPKNSISTSRGGSYEEELQYSPGRLLHLNFGFAPQSGNPLIPIHPPVEIVEAAVNWLDWATKKLMEMAGSPPEMEGITGDRGTATEASLIANASSDIRKSLIRRFESQLLLPAYEIMARVYQTNLTLPVAVMVYDPKTAKHFGEVIEPQMWQGSMVPVARGSTILIEEPIRAQQLINMLTQVAQFAMDGEIPLLNTRGITEEIVRMLDINIDPGRFLKSPEEIAAIQQQMMAQQQQMMQQQMAMAGQQMPQLMGGGRGGGGNGMRPSPQQPLAVSGDIPANRGTPGNGRIQV